ncbi:MAG: hypothetical protein ACOCRO_07065, partial [Halanaerobiales bacterium]
TWKLFELTQGFDVLKFQIDIFLNQVKSKDEYELKQKYNNLVIEFFNGFNGIDGQLVPGKVSEIKNLEKLNEYKEILDYGFLSNKFEIRSLQTGMDRYFYIIASGNSIKDSVDICQKSVKELEIIYY